MKWFNYTTVSRFYHYVETSEGLFKLSNSGYFLNLYNKSHIPSEINKLFGVTPDAWGGEEIGLKRTKYICEKVGFIHDNLQGDIFPSVYNEGFSPRDIMDGYYKLLKTNNLSIE